MHKRIFALIFIVLNGIADYSISGICGTGTSDCSEVILVNSRDWSFSAPPNQEEKTRVACALSDATERTIAALPDTPYDELDYRRTWIVNEITGEEILRDLPDRIQSSNPVYLRQFEDDQDFSLRTKQERLENICGSDPRFSSRPTVCNNYRGLQSEKERRAEIRNLHVQNDLPLWPDYKTHDGGIGRYFSHILPRYYLQYLGEELPDFTRISYVWSKIKEASDRVTDIVNASKTELDRKVRALERARRDPSLRCNDLEHYFPPGFGASSGG